MFIGIAKNDAARALVREAQAIETDERYGGEKLNLRLIRYELPDGRVFMEFQQGASYRQMTIFLALKDANGNSVPETLWTEEEMK